jgi:hypothetical protein
LLIFLRLRRLRSDFHPVNAGLAAFPGNLRYKQAKPRALRCWPIIGNMWRYCGLDGLSASGELIRPARQSGFA